MRNKEFILPTANSSAPRTDEEKQQIIDKATIAYEKYLDALGFDWRNDPNSSETPRRVAKAFVNDLAAGCYDSPPKVTTFPSDGYDGIVSQCNIPVKSMCSHHHLAFTGKAHVAYIPSLDGRVIGLSKLNRIVRHYAKRPQVQERLTRQIAEALMEGLGTNDVAVYLEADHMCVKTRGVEDDGSSTITMSFHGEFEKDMNKKAFLESFR